MLILMSPSKTLDFNQRLATTDFTQPTFLAEATTLANELRLYDEIDIMEQMKVKPALAAKTVEQYALWGEDTTEMRPAIAAFKGEAFTSLEATSFTKEQIQSAQKHLLVLSGLYGALRPLDLIYPYRLDLDCKLKSTDLYAFWKEKVTQMVKERYAITGGPILCLASNEYAKVIDFKQLPEEPIYFDFKEEKDNRLKTIVLYLKRARGAMTRCLLEYPITHLDELQQYAPLNYHFVAIQKNKKWLFVRKA